MKRVDFYLLAREEQQARFMFACKLTEKAYSLENTVYLYTRDAHEAQVLDDLLWTYKDGSFLPHGTTSASFNEQQPILIGSEPTPQKSFDLLINLTDQLPTDISDFKRVAEVLDQNPERKTRGRERFKQYKTMGVELNFHELT